jgi:hypothetical protein
LEVEPGKTLWDWMSLLLVPVVLAIGGTAFAFVQDSRQQDLEDRRAQADALQAYLAQMSTLLIDEAPTTVIEEGDEKKQRPLQDPTAITVARARMLTILGRVDSDPRRPTDEEPKRTVLQFLYEARLIQRDQPVVEFRDANLEQSNLETMVMPHANLSGARGTRIRTGDTMIFSYAACVHGCC